MTSNQHINHAVKWATKMGFNNIKANTDEFESPSQFSKKGEDEPYIPDVVGYKGNTKSYIEIATKDDNIKRKISKWNLLNAMAEIKGGKLYLIAPKGHKAFVQRIIDRYRIDAELIYLPR